MTIDVLGGVAQVDELQLAMSGLGRVCHGERTDLLHALHSSYMSFEMVVLLSVWLGASLGSLSTYPLFMIT
jgi:hypothetical protein